MKISKKSNWANTNILEKYMGGIMERMPENNNVDKNTVFYKITKDGNSYILKSSFCHSNDADLIKLIKEKRELHYRYQKFTTGVAKILEYRYRKDNKKRQYYDEILFEYCCDQKLSSLCGKISANDSLSIMFNLAIIMMNLEDHNIFYTN